MARPGCGSCGGRKSAVSAGASFNPTAQPRPATNMRGMYALNGDDINCEPYRGAFQGTTLFLVGYGTEHEKLFLVKQRVAAYNYAVEHKVSFAHVSVVQLCSDAVIDLLGA